MSRMLDTAQKGTMLSRFLMKTVERRTGRMTRAIQTLRSRYHPYARQNTYTSRDTECRYDTSTWQLPLTSERFLAINTK